jgi:hypothetical protein
MKPLSKPRVRLHRSGPIPPEASSPPSPPPPSPPESAPLESLIPPEAPASDLSTSSATETAATFDALAAETGAGAAPIGAATTAATTGGVFTETEFVAFFVDGFATMTETFELPAMHDAAKRPTAPPAARALYGLASRHEWLRFLIRKGNDDIKDIVAIAFFAGPMARAAVVDIRAKRAKDVTPASA